MKHYVGYNGDMVCCSGGGVLSEVQYVTPEASSKLKRERCMSAALRRKHVQDTTTQPKHIHVLLQ